MTKLIIAGSREFDDWNRFLDLMDALPEVWKELFNNPLIIVSGCARGVDKLGERLAEELKLECEKYPVTPEEWRRLGPAAGHLRNKKMAEAGDCLIAIWDGESKGTRNMIENMVNAAKPFWVIRIDQ